MARFMGIYWIKEWDDTLNMVSVELYKCPYDLDKYLEHKRFFGDDDDYVSIIYSDGVRHIVKKSYFDSINQGLASNSDVNPRPRQCWSPPPSSGRR